MNFIMIDGSGNPNGPEFSQRVQALFGLAYTLRMAPKQGLSIGAWEPWTVYPLEGLWSLVDGARYNPSLPINKDDLVYTIMIRQPSWYSQEIHELVLDHALAKKKLKGDLIPRFETYHEGRVVQMLHLGSFDSEPGSFLKMKDFCRKESLARRGYAHREIYLSDPRTTEPSSMKTVLRYQVRDDYSCV